MEGASEGTEHLTQPEITTERQRGLIGRLKQPGRPPGEGRGRDPPAVRRPRCRGQAASTGRTRAGDRRFRARARAAHPRVSRQLARRSIGSTKPRAASWPRRSSKSPRCTESGRPKRWKWPRQLLQHRRDDGERLPEKKPLPSGNSPSSSSSVRFARRSCRRRHRKRKQSVRRRAPGPTEIAPPPLPPPGLTKLQHVERFTAAMAPPGPSCWNCSSLRSAAFRIGLAGVSFSFCRCRSRAIPAYGCLGPCRVVLDRSQCAAYRWPVRWLPISPSFPFARRQTQRVLPEFLLATDRPAAIWPPRCGRPAEAEKRARKRSSAAARRGPGGAKASSQDIADQLEKNSDTASSDRRRIPTQSPIVEEPNERKLDEINGSYPPRIAQVEQDFERQIVELRDRTAPRLAASSSSRMDRPGDELDRRLAEFQQVIGANEYCDSHFPRLRTRWRRVLAAPHLPRRGNGKRRCGGKIPAAPLRPLRSGAGRSGGRPAAGCRAGAAAGKLSTPRRPVVSRLPVAPARSRRRRPRCRHAAHADA